MWGLCPLRVAGSVRLLRRHELRNLPAVSDPLIFPLEPGLNHERAKWEEGGSEDHGASSVCPPGRFTGEVEQETEEDEESTVNSAWEVDGLLLALDTLEDDRAIEKNEVGCAFQQPG